MHSSRSWYPLCFFSLSLLLIFIILPLTRQGMFMDGVIYAAIAKNLSLGYGSLWQPYYSQTDFPLFYEHPPLVFYFQSLFFRLFGQGFGVEQFYSFLMALGQFALISWYWLKNKNTSFLTLGLLLFLWLLIPLNHIYTNNMLESTLTLFTTFASLVLLANTKSKSAFFLQYLISAIAILVAFFCNGPTAFFPLAVPLLNKLIHEQQAIVKGIKETIFLIALVVLLLGSFYLLVPAALINTQKYFSQQLLASITGTRELNYVGLNHLHIVVLFYKPYRLVTLFALLSLAISAKIEGQGLIKKFKSSLQEKRAWFFLALALVSSLPVGISHRQALNYIMQSAPFFTLAMMYFCFESVKTIADYCKSKPWFFKTLTSLSCLIFVACIAIVFNLASGFNRHKAMLEDLNYLINYCKNDEIISVSPTLYYKWYTGAYLARNSMISVTPQAGKPLYLTLKTEPVPDNYHLIKLPLSYYHLARHD
ncbi:TPA: glycosyltransferase family 39 protein [Legionella feeleii]|uniref:Glycosyltransferase RgtA/B/C/D-like domain-containing protein n=1 Tax=Legionella feeleii TaxID=453 RepID=A0A378IW56_9GAMM|nr:glycosyltransferase family 39 protein [Legionella feeleii]STX39457.1 Uncharacterised protein [Legionella feeleii]